MTPHQDVDRVADWVAETPESIAARLEGAKASQAQIRFTMGVMAIISMMMLIAAYNAYLSYDYGWILKEKDRQFVTKDVPGILAEQALKDWAASRIVQISLLGIRVSIDDVAVLGSACLFVLSLWLVLVARRENHTIGLLLQDTDTPRPYDNRDSSVESRSQVNSSGRRWLIFHTIISNSLFVTVDHSLATVHSLSNLKPMKAGTTGAISAWLHRAGFGLVRNFFFLFPIILHNLIPIMTRVHSGSFLLVRPNHHWPGISPPFQSGMSIFQ